MAANATMMQREPKNVIGTTFVRAAAGRSVLPALYARLRENDDLESSGNHTALTVANEPSGVAGRCRIRFTSFLRMAIPRWTCFGALMHASYRFKRDMPDAVGPLVDQLATAFPACEVWLDMFDFGAARIIRLVCPSDEGRTIVIDASGAEPKLLDELVIEAIRDHLTGED